jgi:hypothetical protein
VPSRIDNAKHWRDRADETLAIASQITHAESKRILLGIAHGYAQLARMAEARKSDKAGSLDK